MVQSGVKQRDWEWLGNAFQAPESPGFCGFARSAQPRVVGPSARPPERRCSAWALRFFPRPERTSATIAWFSTPPMTQNPPGQFSPPLQPSKPAGTSPAKACMWSGLNKAPGKGESPEPKRHSRTVLRSRRLASAQSQHGTFLVSKGNRSGNLALFYRSIPARCAHRPFEEKKSPRPFS